MLLLDDHSNQQDVNDDSDPVVISSPPTELPKEVLTRIVSPSGGKIAVLRKKPIPKNCEMGLNYVNSVEHQILEFWTQSGQKLAQRISLPNNLHEQVCTDASRFGGFAWSPDEPFFHILLNVKFPRHSCIFEHTAAVEDDEDTKYWSQYAVGVGKGEDLGENYTTTVLYLLCLCIQTTGPVSNTNTEGGYVLGQPQFSSGGKSIVYIAWDATYSGKFLCSMYCSQRNLSVYHSSIINLFEKLESNENHSKDVALNTSYSYISEDYKFVYSPRVSNPKLVFLSNESGFDTSSSVMPSIGMN